MKSTAHLLFSPTIKTRSQRNSEQLKLTNNKNIKEGEKRTRGKQCVNTATQCELELKSFKTDMKSKFTMNVSTESEGVKSCQCQCFYDTELLIFKKNSLMKKVMDLKEELESANLEIAMLKATRHLRICKSSQTEISDLCHHENEVKKTIFSNDFQQSREKVQKNLVEQKHEVNSFFNSEPGLDKESSFRKGSVKSKTQHIVHSRCTLDFDIPCNNRFTELETCKSNDSNLFSNYTGNTDTCLEKNEKNDLTCGTKNLAKKSILSSTFSNDLCHGNKTSSYRNESTESIESESNMILQNKKIGKVKLMADSHGRFLRQNLGQVLNEDCEVRAIIKPNGKVCHVLKDVISESFMFDRNDFIILMAGTNDIHKNTDTALLIEEFESKIKHCGNTNIILSAIPFRYDVPFLNPKIIKLNKNLENLAKKYSYVHFLQLNELNKGCYTSFGLHLNKLGKSKLVSMLKSLILLVINDGKNIIPVRLTTTLPDDKFLNKHVFLGKRLLFKNNH